MGEAEVPPRRGSSPRCDQGAIDPDVLVVDTSAILAALIGRPGSPALVEALMSDGDLHAPHLIDVEVIHALRQLVMRGDISEERAQDCRTDFADLVITRYPHQRLSDRMWELRHNLTAYDAAFVALSEALSMPLVTCDARLAEAPGHEADVHLYTA
jgi:predicted nucleic acid-binding protein